MVGQSQFYRNTLVANQTVATLATTGSAPMVGEYRLLAYSFPENGNWLKCDGRNISKASFPMLAEILGEAFGTPATTHFTLPNLSNSTPCGSSYNAGWGEQIFVQHAPAADFPNQVYQTLLRVGSWYVYAGPKLE